MSGEQYTQIKRPVSRLTEKILGWFSWIFLLLMTIITMFIALVSFSNDTSIQNLEATLNNNDLIQQILGNNGFNTTQFVIWLQNGIWAVIVYFIICLLISFLALISMNIRILSGILFLVASVVTLPLVLLFVTLIIPIFFFIIAIMMFARKNKVEIVPAYGYPGYDDNFDNRYNEPDYQQQPPIYDDYERHQPNDDMAYHMPQESSNSSFNEDDKYDQYPKRAIMSDYQSTDDEDETPQVLSRQAKYHKNKYQDEFSDEGAAPFNEAVVQQEPVLDKKELKAQRKQEKAEIKARKREKRKAYNQRMKEKRKNQPSAVNQRRMNYEERKQIFNHENSAKDQQESHLDDSK